MKTAVVVFRPGVNYRKEIFQSGLRKLGYRIGDSPLSNPGTDDVLILWNRFPRDESTAHAYETRGGTVLIVENGYIGQDTNGGRTFAVAKSYHNGAGLWPEGGPERWTKMNVELKPWRSSGNFILVLPQRGFGPVNVAMPQQWAHHVANRLRTISDLPIRVRVHPGVKKTEPYADLKGAWAAVTWGSGAAIKAIAAGYPVFYEFPQWIGGLAARLIGTKPTCLGEPFLGDRLPMFQRLAWAQWSSDEIENGEAFDWLLQK